MQRSMKSISNGVTEISCLYYHNTRRLFEKNYLIMDFEAEKSVKDSFNLLPPDPYLQGNQRFRERRYSVGSINKDYDVNWKEDNLPFFQKKELNAYVGGVSRNFQPVRESEKSFITKLLIQYAIVMLPPSLKGYEFGVHQIRIRTDDNMLGKPAPEGIHQDGFDYVCVSVVTLHNVAGGNSILVDSQDHSKIIFDQPLDAGKMLLFNDRCYAHYASPVVPKLPGAGWRDVFVFTFKGVK